MKVSTHNAQVLDRLRVAISAFEAGNLDLEAIQSVLQSTLSLLENDGSGAAEVVRLAEADVEEIRFTRLLDEQRPAVVFRLDKLITDVADERDA